jgi:hypothetical protein
METVLYELHFRWGDLPVLLIPLLVGIGFWAVSCRLDRSHAAGSVQFQGRQMVPSGNRPAQRRSIYPVRCRIRR